MGPIDWMTRNDRRPAGQTFRPIRPRTNPTTNTTLGTATTVPVVPAFPPTLIMGGDTVVPPFYDPTPTTLGLTCDQILTMPGDYVVGRIRQYSIDHGGRNLSFYDSVAGQKALKAVYDLLLYQCHLATYITQVGTWITDLSTQLSTAINNTNTARSDASTKQTQIDGLNGQVSTLTQNLTDANNALHTSQTDATNKQTQIDTLNGQVTTANAQIATLQTQIASQQPGAVQAMVTDLQTQLATAQRMLLDTQTQLADANRRLAIPAVPATVETPAGGVPTWALAAGAVVVAGGIYMATKKKTG